MFADGRGVYAPAWGLLVLLGLGACEGADPLPVGPDVPEIASDGGFDAGSGAEDASPGPDASSEVDAGEVDGGEVDAGEQDLGTTDLGSTDQGVADAGLEDAGRADLGPADAGMGASVPDPALPGPYMVAQTTASPRAPSRNRLPLDCRYPVMGPSAGPYPAVLIGHGFRISARQYTSYAEHLASFGYVACTADFEAGFRANHVENAEDMRFGLDWLTRVTAERDHPLEGLVDTARLGMMGHSLGGKVSVLAAAADSRIRAVLGLDPVDGGFLCPASRCPDATDLLPLPIPLAFLGETVDASGGAMPCAPAADNFQTFYAAASSPALEVDVLGANHMSFIDDPAACGLPCSLCNRATAPQSQVLELARAYTVAFFERHLRGLGDYDDYLDGMAARMRYVQTMQARVQSK